MSVERVRSESFVDCRLARIDVVGVDGSSLLHVGGSRVERNGDGWDAATRSRNTDQERGGQRAHSDEARLVLSLDCRDPFAEGEVIPLAHVDEVVIGRGGPPRAISRTDRTLAVVVPDEEMSRRHVVLRRALGALRLVDENSKNGTFVNGKRTKHTVLNDGDVIEAGTTIFVLRKSDPAGVRDAIAPDANTANDPSEPPILRTFSPHLERELRRLSQVARSLTPVLLWGESGAGKELVANEVHRRSRRKGESVAVNCAGIPSSLLESELFGWVRGAFTGAHQDRLGHIRSADGGTLFLDEVADLPRLAQGSLLRALQERVVLPLGASRPVPVDLRVVAATHRPLRAMVERDEFRRDLYARLVGFEFILPPVRERREDLGLLIAAILRKHGPQAAHVTLHPKAARALFLYDYQVSNVRELEQALGAALPQAHDGQIQLDHLPVAFRDDRTPIRPPREKMTRERLEKLLRQAKGTVAEAARLLDKEPSQIRRWCRDFSVDLKALRAAVRATTHEPTDDTDVDDDD